jgi:GTP pyrophosphokinase
MLTGRFDEALQLAAQLHRAQVRKGTAIPYVAHLLAVASLALEAGATEDEAIAALLHDAIEDQGGDVARQEIRRHFGDAVTAIVDGCTDAEVTPKPPWRARKEAYIAHVRTAPPSVRLVSSADKLHNARSIVSDLRAHGGALWTRFTGGREGTLWYYRALVDAYRAAGGTPLLDELDRVVTEMEALA